MSVPLPTRWRTTRTTSWRLWSSTGVLSSSLHPFATAVLWSLATLSSGICCRAVWMATKRNPNAAHRAFAQVWPGQHRRGRDLLVWVQGWCNQQLHGKIGRPRDARCWSRLRLFLGRESAESCRPHALLDRCESARSALDTSSSLPPGPRALPLSRLFVCLSACLSVHVPICLSCLLSEACPATRRKIAGDRSTAKEGSTGWSAIAGRWTSKAQRSRLRQQPKRRSNHSHKAELTPVVLTHFSRTH